ncbi:MAG: hypothetical protein AAGL96_19005 [Pseudomonadota bacterium]
MAETKRFKMDEMMTLARRAVRRIDLHGQRGLTDCSTDEIAAMAAVLVVSGALQLVPAAAATHAEQDVQTGDKQ